MTFEKLLPWTFKKRHLIIRWLFSFLLVTIATSSSANSKNDSLMAELHKIILNRNIYISQKENRLDSLRKVLYNASDDKARFLAMGDLLDEFRPYNTDSAFAYCRHREILASRTGNKEFMTNARLNTANVLGSIGMYKEALEIADSIPYNTVPDYLRSYYFYIKRTVASYLMDFSIREEDKMKYRGIFEMCQDSLLKLSEPTSISYVVDMADKYNRMGNSGKAVEILENFLADNSHSIHTRAICANSLAHSYQILGDKEKQKENLLISSIADMKASVREYMSLRQLALLLFEEGDIDNAHKFLSIAMSDAKKCNSRQRILEINDIFPIVDSVYVNEIQHQKGKQQILIVIISILAVFLCIAILWLWKQMKKTSNAHSIATDTNKKLKQLNEELVDLNKKLTEVNQDIAENSKIKEAYITQYMTLCSTYIEKYDSYRKTLNKLFIAGKTDELKKALGSTDLTDEELKAFYHNFDSTFLKLFPTFVADFNKLLSPDEQIVLKKDGQLNTELRITALIRLGITDSAKIAQFLRYSVTTIYNYRVKTRNKALDNRKEFEEKIMEIGLDNI